MHIHVLALGLLGSPQLWLWVENYTMGNMFDYESLLVIFLFIHSQKDEVPPHYGDYTPDHKVIYKFIKTLFHAAQVKLRPHFVFQVVDFFFQPLPLPTS